MPRAPHNRRAAAARLAPRLRDHAAEKLAGALPRTAARAAAAAAAATACYCATLFDTPLRDISERLVRLSRVASAVAAAVADEKYTAWAASGDKQRAPSLDARQAERLRALATANGFLFLKLGQYAAAHPNTPPAYRAALSTLLDKNPPRRGLDLPALLAAELRAPFGSLFAAIDPEPVACASIAQVHKAWLRDGTPVAVKVQHAELPRIADADLAVMEALFLGLHWAYPDTEYMRASWPEWRATLLKELDFANEARNAERVAAHFAGQGAIHVPAVLRAASGARVMTMEWIAGRTLRELLEAPPSGPAEAAQRRALGSAASAFFAQQTLLHGLVHCDPHPANLMVRPHPAAAAAPGAWQLVVIDHGMCKQLDSAFRRAFCGLWRALLLQDAEGARAATRALGLLDGDAEALSQVLTFRSIKAGGRLGAEKSAAEWAQLKKDWEWVTPADVNAFALRLPTDFSFVMRTMALSRGINRSLGGSTRDRLASWGHAANEGLRLGQALGAAALPERPPPAPAPLPPPAGAQVLAAAARALASAFSGGGGGGARGGAGEVAVDSEVLAARQAAAARGPWLGALAAWARAGLRAAQGGADWAALSAALLALDWLAPSAADAAEGGAPGAASSSGEAGAQGAKQAAA